MYKTIAAAVVAATATLIAGQGTAVAGGGLPLPQGVGGLVDLPNPPVMLPTDLPVGGILPAGQ